MGKISTLVLLGLLAAIGAAAPGCRRPSSPHQEIFYHNGHPVLEGSLASFDGGRDADGGIIYLPPNTQGTTPAELEETFEDIIKSKMGFTFSSYPWAVAYEAELCRRMYDKDHRLFNCIVINRSLASIKALPVRTLSGEVICDDQPTCTVIQTASVQVSTTHSADTGLPAEMSATSFSKSVRFDDPSATYGFNVTKASSMFVTYLFDLPRGQTGFVGLVNAQILVDVDIEACACPIDLSDAECEVECKNDSRTITQSGYHEAVIFQNGGSAGLVGLISSPTEA